MRINSTAPTILSIDSGWRVKKIKPTRKNKNVVGKIIEGVAQMVNVIGLGYIGLAIATAPYYEIG